MWKIIKNETPDTITSLFSIRTRVYGGQQLQVSFTIKTVPMKRHIIYQGLLVWNTIPPEIKNKKNIFCFKNAFRKHLRINNK